MVGWLVVLVEVLAACRLSTTAEDSSTVSATIQVPRSGAQFWEGAPVTFRCDPPQTDVTWTSDLQGHLGTGPVVVTSLVVGHHTITLSGTHSSSSIAVDAIPRSATNRWNLPLVLNEGILDLPAGTWTSVVTSFVDEAKVFPLILSVADPAAVPTKASRQHIRPFRTWEALVSDAPQGRGRPQGRQLGHEATFLFPSLDGGSTSQSFSARLVGSNDRYLLYVDVVDPPNEAQQAALWAMLGSWVLPRTEAVWGKPGTGLGTRKTTILCTRKVNQAGGIIGFFNPADLFPQNQDSTSPDYNPSSNEAPLLWVACPDPSSPAFSLDSIAATAAHEYQHLIHFSRKTLPLARLGNYTRFREAVFLDEGMSHWTESMVGLGATGGNLAFCAHYLDKPEDFSLLFQDRKGSYDNAGVRGGICLYLGWLFEKAGGATWDSSDPLRLVDGGGVTLLRSLIDTPHTGVEALEAVLGQSWQQSLSEWADWMNTETMSTVVLDPLTKQPSTVSPFLGAVSDGLGEPLQFQGPHRAALPLDINVLPYSFLFLPPLQIGPGSAAHYQGSTQVGPVIVRSVRSEVLSPVGVVSSGTPK